MPALGFQAKVAVWAAQHSWFRSTRRHAHAPSLQTRPSMLAPFEDPPLIRTGGPESLSGELTWTGLGFSPMRPLL